ncbi:MAG TPA: protein kinase, partial [Aggregatilineales bacterium]|nr:protein kinase [Aggregatilineales bacterium]
MSENLTFGQYEILEKIGVGGMATVYRAHQRKLDRSVAVKIMHQTIAQDENFLARFEREARIIAKLDHPYIVPIYDYDMYEGQPYLVMKYVDGRTLKTILREGPVPPREVLRILERVGSALEYAHEEGILHRDIKPSNIMMDTRGEVYLMDFG